jgi:putative endonuclease
MSARYPFIAVYILASKRNGTLYAGVTSNLPQRYAQHLAQTGGFAAAHACVLLVWYERHERMTDAIRREKRIKKWPRAWKLNLIEQTNPHWLNLAGDIVT